MIQDCLPMSGAQPGFSAPPPMSATGAPQLQVAHALPAPNMNTQGQGPPPQGNKQYREQRIYVPPPAQKRM